MKYILLAILMFLSFNVNASQTDGELLEDAVKRVEKMEPTYQKITNDMECLVKYISSKKDGKTFIQIKPIVSNGKYDCQPIKQLINQGIKRRKE